MKVQISTGLYIGPDNHHIPYLIELLSSSDFPFICLWNCFRFTTLTMQSTYLNWATGFLDSVSVPIWAGEQVHAKVSMYLYRTLAPMTDCSCAPSTKTLIRQRKHTFLPHSFISRIGQKMWWLKNTRSCLHHLAISSPPTQQYGPRRVYVQACLPRQNEIKALRGGEHPGCREWT